MTSFLKPNNCPVLPSCVIYRSQMKHSLWIISSESTLCGKGIPCVDTAKRMADENLLEIWLFILAISAISTASIVEGPVDTLAITGFDAQLNCTINDTVGQPVTWECSECTVTPITVYTTSLYPDKYEVIFVAGLLESYHLRVLNTTTDDESTYQCSIQTIDDAAASLTILTSGPLCVVTPSTFVIEDEEVTLTCAVEKGVPPGELVWYREGVAVSRDGASTTHELSLVFTREDNGTSFTCTLEDETLPPQTEELMTCADDVVIIVQYRSFTYESHEETTEATENVEFQRVEPDGTSYDMDDIVPYTEKMTFSSFRPPSTDSAKSTSADDDDDEGDLTKADVKSADDNEGIENVYAKGQKTDFKRNSQEAAVITPNSPSFRNGIQEEQFHEPHGWKTERQGSTLPGANFSVVQSNQGFRRPEIMFTDLDSPYGVELAESEQRLPSDGEEDLTTVHWV